MSLQNHSYSTLEAQEVTDWNDQAAVIIVGLGAAGVCAAIEARQAGADVFVLERASGGGGLTCNAAGHLYLGGGTRVQKACGYDDNVKEMMNYLMSVTPEPDEAKIRLYCEDSVEHFNWLVAHGVPFNDDMHQHKTVVQLTTECLIWSGNEEVWPYREKAKAIPRGHKVAMDGHQGGTKLMEVLIAKAEALGVRIQTDAAVDALYRNNDGRVVGVRYRHFEEERNAKASQGVVLTTGHFTWNEDMLQKYCPRLADPRIERQGGAFDDGAGIQLGLSAGGEAIHMDGFFVTSPFYPPESLLKGILVNQEGKRFVAEDSYHSRSTVFNLEQPNGVVYLIADDECFGRPEMGGQELIDAWDSIEEMANALETPELVQTIASYNEHASRGDDPEFHKGAKWLKPLTTPPFAAIQCSFGKAWYTGFTLGGLRTSIDGELLDASQNAIPGLYAAGGCASNIAQDGIGYSSGTCIGEATFFGRRAGLHAAKQNSDH